MTLRIQKNIEIFASNGIRISLQRGLKIELTDVNEISAYGTVAEVKFNLNSRSRLELIKISIRHLTNID